MDYQKMNKTQMLLVLLMEECAEVSQRASKAVRFGLDEVQEGQIENNARRLWGEYCDLVAVYELLCEQSAVVPTNRFMIESKKAKVAKWMLHSESCGMMEKQQEPKEIVPVVGQEVILEIECSRKIWIPYRVTITEIKRSNYLEGYYRCQEIDGSWGPIQGVGGFCYFKILEVLKPC